MPGEADRIRFLLRRDGYPATRRWVERTLQIYRDAIAPGQPVGESSRRELFERSIAELGEWLDAHPAESPSDLPQETSMSLTIRSPVFQNGQNLPFRYSRDGGNVSPPIEWSDPPEGTRSFALIVEDPDAPRGTFRHWAVYNIDASEHGLAEGSGSRADNRIRMAVNDFGNRAYDGPQPPPGHGTHHYHFRLFALDVPKLDLPDGSKAADVLQVARSHAIAEADTVGTFER